MVPYGTIPIVRYRMVGEEQKDLVLGQKSKSFDYAGRSSFRSRKNWIHDALRTCAMMGVFHSRNIRKPTICVSSTC